MVERREIPYVACGVLAAAALAVSTAVGGRASLVVIALILVGFLIVIPTRWLIALTMTASWLVLPAAISPGITVEALLVFTTCVLLARGRLRDLPRAVVWVAALMTMGLVVGAAVGLASGNERGKIILDFRGPAVTVLAALVTAAALLSPGARALATRTLLFILWASAGVMLVANLTGITVAGTVQEASLSGSALGATRFQTTATPLALTVLCGLVGLALMRRDWRELLPYAIPASLITALGFSRNALLALAVAGVFTVLMSGKLLAARRAVGIVLVAGLALATLYVASFVIPGGASVRTQYDAFRVRVVDGIFGGSTAESDFSITYRNHETAALVDGFRSSPLVGHGLGFAYKDPEGATGSFTDTTGRYYAHNLYLWFLAKTGLIGTAAFVGACFYALVHAWRRKAPYGAALAGVMAASYVAPLPFSSSGGGATAFGAALTLAAMAIGATKPAGRQGEPVPVGLGEGPNLG